MERESYVRFNYTGLACGGGLQTISATIEASHMFRAMFTSHRLRDFLVLEERTECIRCDFEKVDRAF